MFTEILHFFQNFIVVRISKMTEIVSTHWFPNKLKWVPTTIEALEKAEKKVLSYIKRPFQVKFVEILSHDEKSLWKIRTLIMKDQTKDSEKKVPLVMLHGLGAAIGYWILNLDNLSKKRPLYACDLLGFGMSSRPTFSKNPEEVKEQYIKSLELWRQEIGLEKFILLGHSMGGYIATAYAMKYPQHIHHLILAEPWGFPEQGQFARPFNLPLWAKMIKSIAVHFSPFAGLRFAGPWGPQLVEKLRPDILYKFSNVIDNPNEMANYIYHCNAQTPSGEMAFKIMCKDFGYAKEPMIPRIDMLHKDVSITFLYGSHSWMDNRSGFLVKEIRSESYVTIHIIPESGHHVCSDHPTKFNSIVQEICSDVDEHVIIDTAESSVNKKIDMSDDDVIEKLAEVFT